MKCYHSRAIADVYLFLQANRNHGQGEGLNLKGGQDKRRSEPSTEQLYGVAIQFKQHPSGVLCVNVIKEGGPAWGKGILPGDVIASVDGRDVLQEPFEKVSPLIKGPQGSVVSIGFLRPEAESSLEENGIPVGQHYTVKIRRQESVFGRSFGSGRNLVSSSGYGEKSKASREDPKDEICDEDQAGAANLVARSQAIMQAAVVARANANSAILSAATRRNHHSLPSTLSDGLRVWFQM